MSSKVFVYNQYDPIDKEEKGILELTHGLFFDGTLNKLGNTEIRKKVKGLDGYGNPTQEDIDIYNREAKKFSLWSWSREEKEDDSFANDFTNVARMKMSCDEKYAIYVEGPGTSSKKGGSDDTYGYAFGTYETGIRYKVRGGCEKLGDKILDKKRELEEKGIEIKTITLNIDVFGFSRGAATARNFLYEIRKKAYAPILIKRAINYKEDDEWKTKWVTDKCDNDGNIIDQNWLHENKLPKMGYLGIALFDLGFSHEELATLKIKIETRFLGLYDTVSSYSKDIALFPNFKNDVQELNLNSLGRIKKAVHFTAQDEHRENFSLTRMNIGIEKNLPGVHSDIGGSYSNGTETVKEIENDLYALNVFFLTKLRLKLIKQYWFKPSQIKVKKTVFNKRSWVLRGERALKKEYSYIPLHFMKDHALEYIKDYLLSETEVETKYSIEDDPVLRQTKTHLKDYAMDKGGEEWKFISDEALAHQKKLKKLQEETEEQKKERVFNELMKKRLVEKDNLRVDTQTTDKYGLIESKALEEELEELTENEKKGILLDEVMVTAYSSQGLLRKLRNEYLHWSAKREGIGYDPTSSRKREEY